MIILPLQLEMITKTDNQSQRGFNVDILLLAAFLIGLLISAKAKVLNAMSYRDYISMCSVVLLVSAVSEYSCLAFIYSPLICFLFGLLSAASAASCVENCITSLFVFPLLFTSACRAVCNSLILNTSVQKDRTVRMPSPYFSVLIVIISCFVAVYTLYSSI